MAVYITLSWLHLHHRRATALSIKAVWWQSQHSARFKGLRFGQHKERLRRNIIFGEYFIPLIHYVVLVSASTLAPFGRSHAMLLRSASLHYVRVATVSLCDSVRLRGQLWCVGLRLIAFGDYALESLVSEMPGVSP